MQCVTSSRPVTLHAYRPHVCPHFAINQSRRATDGRYVGVIMSTGLWRDVVEQTIDVINVITFFIQVTFLRFLTFFFIFPRFLFKKTLSNAKYKYVKIQQKIFLEDDLAMIFIDFGLAILQNILLTCWRALKSYKFGNLTTYIWLSVQR